MDLIQLAEASGQWRTPVNKIFKLRIPGRNYRTARHFHVPEKGSAR